jgi:hypothetical protein
MAPHVQAHPLPGPRRRLGLFALLLVLAACGDDAPEPPPAGPRPTPPRWKVEIPTPEQQARFALDRILTGPLPQDVLPLPNLHQQTLRMAQQDLGALPAETLALLSDPALIARLTGPGAKDLNPWDSLLDVLLGIRDKPSALALAWAEPTLLHDVPTLWLKAVDVLGSLEDPAAGPALLRILERAIDQREISRSAWNALARLPSPWPDRALGLVRRRGLPDLWVEVVPALEQALEARVPAPGRESLIGWWGLLAESGGPRGPRGLSRLRTLPWSQLAKTFDPGVPRSPPGGTAGRPGIGPWTERAGVGSGWLPSAPEDACVRSLNELAVVGAEPAAEARCALARRGVSTFKASVAADLAAFEAARASLLESRPLLRTKGETEIDAELPPLVLMLGKKAKHCLMAVGEDPTSYWEQRFAYVRQVASGEVPPPLLADVVTDRQRLPSADKPEGRALLLRILTTVRPFNTWQMLLEGAYDALARAGLGVELDFVRERLQHADSAERALAVHLAQRARSLDLLAPLDEALGKASVPERSRLRHAIAWIYAAGGVEPRALEAFTRRFASWIEETDDERAVGLATGLLDYGEPGVQRFLEGLRGPRQRVFLAALAGYGSILPVEVAEALADLLGANLPPDLRHTILVVLWRSAPASASPAVAAAKPRLDPAERGQVDVVLETIRHRAAHP